MRVRKKKKMREGSIEEDWISRDLITGKAFLLQFMSQLSSLNFSSSDLEKKPLNLQDSLVTSQSL